MLFLYLAVRSYGNGAVANVANDDGSPHKAGSTPEPLPYATTPVYYHNRPSILSLKLCRSEPMFPFVPARLAETSLFQFIQPAK